MLILKFAKISEKSGKIQHSTKNRQNYNRCSGVLILPFNGKYKLTQKLSQKNQIFSQISPKFPHPQKPKAPQPEIFYQNYVCKKLKDGGIVAKNNGWAYTNHSAE